MIGTCRVHLRIDPRRRVGPRDAHRWHLSGALRTLCARDAIGDAALPGRNALDGQVGMSWPDISAGHGFAVTDRHHMDERRSGL